MDANLDMITKKKKCLVFLFHLTSLICWKLGEVCKPSFMETLEKFSYLYKTLSKRIYLKWPKKKVEMGDAASPNSAYCRSIEETFNTLKYHFTTKGAKSEKVSGWRIKQLWK